MAPEDAAEEIAKLYENNRKPDITLECSGAEASVRTGVFATHHGGVLVCIGIGPNDVKVPLVIAGMHEVDIKGPSTVIYGWGGEKLLPCGARVVIETESDVEIVR